MENELQKTNSGNSWSKEDIENLGMALTAVYDNLSSYGQPLNLKSRIGLWKMTLQDHYPMDSVLKAIQSHCRVSTDMVVPAHVEALLNPPAAKITQAEFIHAKEQWKLEGYPSYSYYATVVKDYEKENAEDRAPGIATEDKKLLDVAKSAVKMIS